VKTRSDDFDLATELRALRPAPRAEFTAELDARAAEGFPRKRSRRASALARLAARLRLTSPRRALAPVVASVLLGVVVAAALIAGNEQSGSEPPGGQLLSKTDESASPVRPQGPPSTSSGGGAEYQSSVAPSTSSLEGAGGGGRRDVERDAELVLRSAPDKVGEDAGQVLDTVHDVNGIVLSSSVDGEPSGSASAEFRLLIPVAQLGDAMASLSRIAEVGARHEATRDITAPTVSVRDRLRDSEATIEGMLGQLEAAESYSERSLLERQLRRERRHAAALRSRLDRLRERARFARVSVSIEGSASSSGAWSTGEALDDAGRVLSVAAGVALVALAVLSPLAAIALIAWLARRLWLGWTRRRALG
jgi:Domain of unknown function (DUF4349)